MTYKINTMCSYYSVTRVVLIIRKSDEEKIGVDLTDKQLVTSGNFLDLGSAKAEGGNIG